MLLQPLFICIAGVGAAALVILTAPLWSALAARLSDWIAASLNRASRTVDDTIRDRDENIVEGRVVDPPARTQDDAPSDAPSPASHKESKA